MTRPPTGPVNARTPKPVIPSVRRTSKLARPSFSASGLSRGAGSISPSLATEYLVSTAVGTESSHVDILDVELLEVECIYRQFDVKDRRDRLDQASCRAMSGAPISIRRGRAYWVVGLVAVISVLAVWGVHELREPTRSKVVRAAARLAPVTHRRVHFRVVERATGILAQPVRDAAVAPVGKAMMLLGGLTASDVSRPDVRIASPAGDRSAGNLPTALHDTAAVRIGRSVYLFGGGTGANTQSDAIVRIPATG